MDTEKILHQTRANYCLDCGKCTGSCPVTRVDATYSPRSTIERVLAGRPEELIDNTHLWSCLTCRRCSAVCPSGVDYPAFVIAMRIEARNSGVEGTYAHNAIMQQLMAAMAHPLQQNRTGWLTDDLETRQQGEDFYFVGCLPYFDVVFADLGIVSTQTARSAVRLMNALGIVPVVSDDERCCGADLLLNGEEKDFRRLAEINVQVIADSGAQRVIFTCPEGYNAFRNDYPDVVGELPFEVVHLSELLAEHLDELEFEPLDEVVTYHDPCRLGRYMGVYEPPRAAIQAVPGVELVEMRHNREKALCCGSTGWVNCGRCAKGIQMTRLGQAQASSARRMITTCPKCRIHLTCALKDAGAEFDLKLEDLTDLLARSLKVGNL
ncbi:MAG: (Fe-S)-binding protein [Anaerolineae bacterium]|nr:(Fe-S)-binding protein [Anaerolineae bacterium]